jgi:choline-sulfatase
VKDPARYTFMGRDLTPILRDAADNPTNPTVTVQDSVYFTTDETLGEEIVRQPSHIACLREAEWKVAEYYDPSRDEASRFELYDLANDPLELCNRGNPDKREHFDAAKLSEMVAKLHGRMAEVRSDRRGKARKGLAYEACDSPRLPCSSP